MKVTLPYFSESGTPELCPPPKEESLRTFHRLESSALHKLPASPKGIPVWQVGAGLLCPLGTPWLSC